MVLNRRRQHQIRVLRAYVTAACKRKMEGVDVGSPVRLFQFLLFQFQKNLDLHTQLAFSVATFHSTLHAFVHKVAQYRETSGSVGLHAPGNVLLTPTVTPRHPKFPRTLSAEDTLGTVKPVLPEVAHGPLRGHWFFGRPRRESNQESS